MSVEVLPTSKLRNDDNCAMCLSAKTVDIAAISCCKHTFHQQCIMWWSKITNKCPLCKARFSYITSLSTHQSIHVAEREQTIDCNEALHGTASSVYDAEKCQVCQKAEPTHDALAMICDGCDKVPSDPFWFCSHRQRRYEESVAGIRHNENTSGDHDHDPAPQLLARYKDDLSDYADDEAVESDGELEGDEWTPHQPENQSTTDSRVYHEAFGVLSRPTTSDGRQEAFIWRKGEKHAPGWRGSDLNKSGRSQKKSFDGRPIARQKMSKTKNTMKILVESKNETDSDSDCELIASRRRPRRQMVVSTASSDDAAGDVRAHTYACCEEQSKSKLVLDHRKRKLLPSSSNAQECKRRKIASCCEDAGERVYENNVGVSANDERFYGLTSKTDGIRIVKDRLREPMWNFTFKKKAKKKKKRKYKTATTVD